MLLALTAFAQEGISIDAEAFRASSDARRTISTDEAGIQEGWTAAAAVHYQRSPIVFIQDDVVTAVVRDALALDISASVSIWRLRLGLTAPAYLLVTSDVDPTRTVLGDPGLHGKALLFGTKGDTRFNIALLGSLDLPLGAHRYYLGSRSVAGRGGLALDLTAGPVFIVANGGLHLQAPQNLQNVRLRNQVFVRGAIGVQPVERLAIAVETLSKINLVSSSTLDNSLELMLGIHRTGPGVSPYGSFGAALTPGIGSPIVRGMLGVRVAPAATER